MVACTADETRLHTMVRSEFGIWLRDGTRTLNLAATDGPVRSEIANSYSPSAAERRQIARCSAGVAVGQGRESHHGFRCSDGLRWRGAVTSVTMKAA